MLEFTADDIHIDDFARGGILRYIAKRDKILAWELCRIYGKGRRKEEIDKYDAVYKRLQDRKIFLEAMTWEDDQAIAKRFHVTVSYVRAVIGRQAALRLRGELGGRPKSQANTPSLKPVSQTAPKPPL